MNAEKLIGKFIKVKMLDAVWEDIKIVRVTNGKVRAEDPLLKYSLSMSDYGKEWWLDNERNS